MKKIKIMYEGDLHTKIMHPSHEIFTDAPLDNGGKGLYLSPTDLFAASLGSCIATVMGLFAKKHKLDLSDMHLEVEKTMSTTGERRISSLKVEIFMARNFSSEIKDALEKIAHSCPVHKSLHPDIHLDIKIHWPTNLPSL